jgi:hypothetical protein
MLSVLFVIAHEEWAFYSVVTGDFNEFSYFVNFSAQAIALSTR